MRLDDPHYVELCRVALKKLRGEMDYLLSFNRLQVRTGAPLVNTTGLEDSISFLEEMFKEDG